MNLRKFKGIILGSILWLSFIAGCFGFDKFIYFYVNDAKFVEFSYKNRTAFDEMVDIKLLYGKNITKEDFDKISVFPNRFLCKAGVSQNIRISWFSADPLIESKIFRLIIRKATLQKFKTPSEIVKYTSVKNVFLFLEPRKSVADLDIEVMEKWINKKKLYLVLKIKNKDSVSINLNNLKMRILSYANPNIIDTDYFTPKEFSDVIIYPQSKIVINIPWMNDLGYGKYRLDFKYYDQ